MTWHITYYTILNGLKTYDIHSNRQIKSNKHKARHHSLWALRRQCLFWNFLCSSWPFLGVVCVAWLMLILVSAWKRCSDGTTACAGAGSGPRTAVFGPFEPAETRKNNLPTWHTYPSIGAIYISNAIFRRDLRLCSGSAHPQRCRSSFGKRQFAAEQRSRNWNEMPGRVNWG